MSDYLPPEVILEILHRLSLKSLVRCTSVSKAWKSLITSQAFISGHLTHLKTSNHGNSSLFVQIRRSRLTSRVEEFYSLYSDVKETHLFHFLKFPLNHLFSLYGYTTVTSICNGLVLLTEYSALEAANAVIWNPCIQKYVILPKPTLTFQRTNLKLQSYGVIYGFGFDCTNNDFKVIKFVTLHSTEAIPHVEIYSLASRSWRMITAQVPSFFLPHYAFGPPHMFMNGILHWAVKRSGDDGGIYYFILSFDVVEEKFGELMLPQCLKDSSFQVSILPEGDTLAVIQQSFDRNFLKIWVMKDYGVVESWTQLLHFDTTHERPEVLTLSRGQVVLSCYYGIVLLDPLTKLRRTLMTFNPQCFSIFAGNYVLSLFLLDEKLQTPFQSPI